jgi:hypothetical protein
LKGRPHLIVRENLNLGMIEKIKDEQVNIRKQVVRVISELKTLKGRIGNISSQVGVMLVINSSKVVPNSNQIHLISNRIIPLK